MRDFFTFTNRFSPLKTLLFLTAFGVILSTQVFGQSLAEQGCASPAEKPAWLIEYQKNPHNFHARSGNEIIYMPLVVHTLGDDRGEGHYPTLKIFESICRLNADFAPYNIQFYLKEPVNQINRTRFYEHDGFPDGFQMMRTYRRPQAINTFITATAPSDACGYFHPSGQSIVVVKNCMGGNGHTWTHEVGHWLSLPHTFSGWEGKDYDPNGDTPLFHGVSGRDTLYVESVQGKNCHKAADGFCDTPPDYLSVGWNCNGSAQSLVVQKDPFGSDFRSNGANFMSYSVDACQSEFSLEQAEAMRTYIDFEKRLYANQKSPIQDVAPFPVAINHPEPDEKLHHQSIHLEWQHHPNTTHYLVQISRFSFFAVIDYEFIVEGNNINIGDLPVDKKYYWRIMPYNAFDFCGEFTDAGGFETFDITSVAEIDGNNELEVTPTLVPNSGIPISIQFDFSEILPTDLKIFDVRGALLYQQHLPNPSRDRIEINTSDLSAGMYLLDVATSKGRIVKKISVQ